MLQYTKEEIYSQIKDAFNSGNEAEEILIRLCNSNLRVPEKSRCAKYCNIFFRSESTEEVISLSEKITLKERDIGKLCNSYFVYGNAIILFFADTNTLVDGTKCDLYEADIRQHINNQNFSKIKTSFLAEKYNQKS